MGHGHHHGGGEAPRCGGRCRRGGSRGTRRTPDPAGAATASPPGGSGWRCGAARASRCLRRIEPCRAGMVNLPWHRPWPSSAIVNDAAARASASSAARRRASSASAAAGSRTSSSRRPNTRRAFGVVVAGLGQQERLRLPPPGPARRGRWAGPRPPPRPPAPGPPSPPRRPGRRRRPGVPPTPPRGAPHGGRPAASCGSRCASQFAADVAPTSCPTPTRSAWASNRSCSCATCASSRVTSTSVDPSSSGGIDHTGVPDHRAQLGPHRRHHGRHRVRGDSGCGHAIQPTHHHRHHGHDIQTQLWTVRSRGPLWRVPGSSPALLAPQPPGGGTRSHHTQSRSGRDTRRVSRHSVTSNAG